MTWIRTIPPAIAEGALSEAYKKLAGTFPSEYAEPVRALTNPDGTMDSIVSSHSLIPSVMEPIFRAAAEMMSPDLPLSRRQHEMINTVVSALNRCHY